MFNKEIVVENIVTAKSGEFHEPGEETWHQQFASGRFQSSNETEVL